MHVFESFNGIMCILVVFESDVAVLVIAVFGLSQFDFSDRVRNKTLASSVVYQLGEEFVFHLELAETLRYFPNEHYFRLRFDFGFFLERLKLLL